MPVLLPDELTQTEIDNINQFTKNYEIRVKLFRDVGLTAYSTTGIADGDYNSSLGVYTISPERIWLKSVYAEVPADASYNVFQLKYEDENGDFIVALTEKWEDANHHLKVPVYAKKFKFNYYKENDPTDRVVAPTTPTEPYLLSDSWFEIQSHLGTEIRIENAVGDLNGNIKLPFVSIALNNISGNWSKDVAFSLPVWYLSRSSGEITTSSTSVTKRAGLRIVIEMKFYGPQWQGSDWIILGTFHARKWTSNNVSGEAGWIAKTIYKTPIIEGATLGSILEDYIVREKGKMLIQLSGTVPDEVITVSNEFVGEADLEPILPTKLLDGQQIHCHAQDDRHIYYALKNVTGANTSDGGYIEIRRVTKSGEDDEHIGKIYAIPNDSFFLSSADRPFLGSFWSDSDPTQNNNNPIFRYVRAAYSMAIDGDSLYISILTSINGHYEHPTISSWLVWSFESHILKLSKDGSGWNALVGPTTEETDAPNTFGTAYTVTDFKYSLGYDGNAYVSSPQSFDPYDVLVATNYIPVIRGLMIFDDAGTKKLLFVKERQRKGDKSPPMSEFWIVNLDFSGAALAGDEGTGTRVECMLSFSDVVQYVHFSTFSGGGSELSKELGILSRDASTGDFFIAEYGRSGLSERFLSMSFFGEGIFGSGNAFDGGSGYNPNSENVASDGIKEKYQCVFVLDGFSIVHANHATRNEYITYSVPDIFIGGIPINFNTVIYAEEYLSGDIFVTTGWVLDLRTGTVILRQAISSTDPLEITANYDFVRSVMFYEGDSESRLNKDALGKISQAMTGNLYIDECECIRKLPFLESQQIPINHVLNPYANESEDLGEHIDGGIGGVILAATLPVTEDKLLMFQFTPDFDGVLEFIRIPIKLSETGTPDPADDTPRDFDIYLTGDTAPGIDCGSTDGNTLDDPPVSSLIKTLLEGSEEVYIAQAQIDSVTGSSPFYWVSFDVSSANESVVKGTNYGIILRTHNTENPTIYTALAKEVSILNNLCGEHDITDGNSITSISAAGWRTVKINEGAVALGYLEIRKTKVELKSVDIIDALNPNISSGFESVQGGSDTTVNVVSDDFQTTYIAGTDYNITYSGGKFFIDFPGGGALADRTKSIIVRWYESKTDLLSISDQKLEGTEKEIVSEFAEFGDQTTFLRTIIKGQKLRPADTNVRIEKAFELFPGILLDLEQENTQTKKIETNTINQWNDKKNAYEPASDLEGESSKFVFEFRDPFIIGTTAYTVKYGRGHSNGASPDDPVQSGTVTTTFSQDVPKFYEVAVSAFSDTNYHVMLKPQQYREWRLATSEDFGDMTSDNVIGTAPTGSGDVFTATHFYLKRMNQSFGERNANWIAYTSEERIFYIDEYGVVVRDDSFVGSDEKNPIPSAYTDKTIFFLVEPIDFAGNPLFEAHSEGGDGDDPDMLSSIKKYMSANIDRTTINSNGANIIYSNFDTQKKFLKITVIGFPINNIVSIREERRKEGFEHADAKTIEINNNLIQTQAIASRKSGFMMDFWGKERVNFTKDIVMDPRIRPGIIAKVSSEREGLTNALFYMGATNLLLSVNSGFKQTLSKFLQI
jgi:hypothetical protein